ncbi:PAS domain-containing protein [Nannocystis punicea]|uniref:PAS domain-containing protein n=1 Tax=Nannocystis punicea TaxID=2995304 RepID=A0ABY7GTA1_9BACT|nr:PAS domain-containing protein [Nannocystis poenicansa]WAS90191.1 PAS domain-containing protein [Nannocystis poenicansa]
MTEPESLDDPTAELARLQRRVVELEAELAVLRPSEAELRAMFRAMSDVVLVMSRDGHYLRIGDTAPDLLYKPSADLVGQRMHDVMPAAAADFFLEHIRRALDHQSVVSMDYSLPLDDREVWFSANISPLSDDAVVLVCRDVTERKRNELLLQDSLRQQELLRAHEAALLQLSTPLIPISDDLVVMPLVGRLDGTRIDHVLQTLLEGVQRTRAAVVILDVTGVAVVDAPVADALVRAARAVGLLGARVVLTGIRPEVAAALVSLGTDLMGLVTRGTLQDGIRHAQVDLVARRPRS